MKERDSFWVWGGAAAAALAAVALGAYYFYQREHTPAATAPVAAATPPIATPAPPPPVAVTPPVVREIPLPALDESDEEVRGGLTEIFGRDAVQQLLVPTRIVRNVVVSIDNLPREKMAVQQRPARSTPGEFLTSGAEDAPVIARENYARYTPYVKALSTLDAKTLVSLYRGLQPLFQQAYEELGHPDAFFNTRLLEVIDHLLATPEVREPIRLVQPSVFYKYADKNLEELSTGQKLMIRIGPENAAAVKTKLREIQAELI